MSNLASFADLVRSMRAAQKKYFKSRLQTDMQRAMNLERQVDSQLEKIPKPEPKPEQIRLPTSME
jgi:hypothetical protein